jgi:hypothetical protein
VKKVLTELGFGGEMTPERYERFLKRVYLPVAGTCVLVALVCLIALKLLAG